MIDLRSDTITQPTPGMRRAIYDARVGDDVFGEDPTVNLLQQTLSEITGKPAALFVASGTMGNQVCIKSHTKPGNEVILERNSHIFNYECGSPAMLSGVQLLPLEGNRGHFTVEQVREVVRLTDDHHPKTKLIALENTHNRSGGTIFPIEEMIKISEFSLSKGIKLHLDGARLWNATIKTGISIWEYCNLFDSVSLCFSKGLGAPAGSIIAGSKKFIEKARYHRKAFGGGMRQIGILAAAALYAIENNMNRLNDDHDRASKLGESLADVTSVDIDLKSLQTNMVLFDVKKSGMSGREVISKLAKKKIKMLTVGETKIRAVTHLQITDSDIEKTIKELQTIFLQN